MVVDKIRLHPLPQENGKKYCGPSVLAALSGKPYAEVLMLAERVTCHQDPREIKRMSFSALHECIVDLGFKTEAEHLDDDGADSCVTMAEWIKGRDYLAVDMGDDPANDTWVLNLTGHFVIVQGGFFLDNHTKLPVPISEAPFMGKLVRKALKVMR